MTTVVAAVVRGRAEVGAGDAPEVGGKAANLGELVAAGLPASISVNPDAVDTARAAIASAERRVLLEAARAVPARP